MLVDAAARGSARAAPLREAHVTADDIIHLLGLAPLPVEGGYYRETWRSSAGTAIYYLLTSSADSFSAMHRLPIDEVFHFYLGDAVEQLRLHPDGRTDTVVIGADLARGQVVQTVVPAGVWQGSRLRAGGRFALMGTTMAPGFEPRHYEAGARAELIGRYPSATAMITSLTR
jgi:uncharacterized protein